MTIKTLFPHASKSFLQINGENIAPRGEIPPPKPQCANAKPLGAAVQGKEKSVGRPTVRFRGYRVRPLDSDNFAAACKDLCDGLWRSGAVDGDAPWQIITIYEQEKVASFAEERIEIEITYP